MVDLALTYDLAIILECMPILNVRHAFVFLGMNHGSLMFGTRTTIEVQLYGLALFDFEFLIRHYES